MAATTGGTVNVTRFRRQTALTSGTLPAADPLYHSNYHIVVNSNRRATGPVSARELGAQLVESVEAVLGDGAVLSSLIQWQDEPGVIQKAELQTGAEVGSNPRGGRVHVHVVLQLIHTKQMHLWYRMARELIGAQTSARAHVPRPYVSFKLIARDPMWTLEQYIEKTRYAPPHSVPPGGYTNLEQVLNRLTLNEPDSDSD